MTIPMVDLRPMLAATEPAWRANLERLFERMQFILGEQVDAFERELAAAWGARFAVTAGSGTAAIELGIRAAGLAESGEEVVVPALTSPFTAQAIRAAGCRPRGLVLLQDACPAHGAQEAGRPFTSFSPAVAYSFYPTKNLPCLGDGGRRHDQVARTRAINSRLDEIEACYLRAFLPKLAEWNQRRARLAALYGQALAGCDGVRPVGRRAGSVCHLYVVRAAGRARLRKFLAERGGLPRGFVASLVALYAGDGGGRSGGAGARVLQRGVVDHLRRRGFLGFHLKRKRLRGHRAVVAFRQQGVVGGVFRHDFQAMIGKGINFLNHGRDAHGFGVLHAIA